MVSPAETFIYTLGGLGLPTFKSHGPIQTSNPLITVPAMWCQIEQISVAMKQCPEQKVWAKNSDRKKNTEAYVRYISQSGKDHSHVYSTEHDLQNTD